MGAGRPVTLQGWLAAGLLAILTVFVFTTLRNQGPANAVRRFHAAVLERDARELEAVTVEPPSDVAPHILINGTQALFARGAREAAGYPTVRRRGAFALVEVRYEHPNGRSSSTLWLVRQTRPAGVWKVDAAETIRVRRQALGF